MSKFNRHSKCRHCGNSPDKRNTVTRCDGSRDAFSNPFNCDCGEEYDICVSGCQNDRQCLRNCEDDVERCLRRCGLSNISEPCSERNKRCDERRKRRERRRDRK